jgi:NAD(P)H-hydrate epimerase
MSHSLPTLPDRPDDSHKGDFGRALLVAGSCGMSGAAALAGMAALRGGAGLVTVAVPDVCQSAVAAAEPSMMTLGLASNRLGQISSRAVDRLEREGRRVTAWACGPGLGRSLGPQFVAVRLYTRWPQAGVIDADALHALAGREELLHSPGGPRILSPHPLEFGRLIGLSAGEVQSNRERLAAEYASRWGVVVLLKGAGTVISDGRQTCVNQTGNPAMATGGSGDVLTGLLAALLCQGLSAFDAARLGAHLHGLAGDLAAQTLGSRGITASDLTRYLPAAMSHFHAQR